ALAVSVPPRVSFGEGWTPLVLRDWQGAEVSFKLESQRPTGSFKDRGTAVMLNHLLALGVGPIHEDSSGNAGASLATYAAAAGLPCQIYVPPPPLPARRRPAVPDLCPGPRPARQNRADRRRRRRGVGDPRHSPVGHRG